MENKIIEILAYTIPSMITAAVAYGFFQSYFKDQQNTRKWMMHKELQKEALPLRLQAYERMTLFLERIALTKILIRVSPNSDDKTEYHHALILHIEQEFEHNLTQQIYMSATCWTIIQTAKNATIAMIRNANAQLNVHNAQDLRELLLTNLFDKDAPTNAALANIKDEVMRVFG